MSTRHLPPLILYHADCTDGYGAAFCAWLRFGAGAQYCPIQHGLIKNTADFDAMFEVTGRSVYVLDFSFSRDVMTHLIAQALHVTWLDHHKTAFEVWCGPAYLSTERQQYIVQGASATQSLGIHSIVLDNTRSGARIAWDYFFPGKSLPRLIAHIDDYDRWQFAIPHSKEFNLALKSMEPWTFSQWDELNTQWGRSDEMMPEPYWAFIAQGVSISRMQGHLIDSIIPDAVPIWIPGAPEPGLAITCPLLLANDVGAALSQHAPYVACWYHQGNGLIKCSLRSADRTDVAALAQKHGGGGHLNSAAFRVPLERFSAWLT